MYFFFIYHSHHFNLVCKHLLITTEQKVQPRCLWMWMSSCELCFAGTCICYLLLLDDARFGNYQKLLQVILWGSCRAVGYIISWQSILYLLRYFALDQLKTRDYTYPIGTLLWVWLSLSLCGMRGNNCAQLKDNCKVNEHMVAQLKCFHNVSFPQARFI